MRKRDPKTTRLTEQPLLESLSPRELDRLSPLFDEVALPAGTVLMRQGFTAGETFLIRTGKVLVSIDGTEVAQLGAGDVVGEMAVLNHSSRTATVTAVTDITAFVVTPRVLATLVREPGVGGRIAELVAGRTR